MRHCGVVETGNGNKFFVFADKAPGEVFVGRKLKREDILLFAAEFARKVVREAYLAVSVLIEKRQKLRLNIEFSLLVAANHMNRRAGHNENGLVNVYVFRDGMAARVLYENPSRNGKRTVCPAVKNKPAVAFDAYSFIAHIDL